IYYGTEQNNFSKVIDVGNLTEYKIENLATGDTYYFVITAYDTAGNESEYSNEVNITKYSIVIMKEGSGIGNIISYPYGINCGYDCKGFFKKDSVIILIANSMGMSNFEGWSEDICEGYPYCILTINKNLNLTAKFSSPIEPLTVTYPNGGESILAGSICNITWIAPPEAEIFEILYSLNKGIKWQPLAINIKGTNYYQKVPDTIMFGEEKGCLIKVIGCDASGTPLVEDISDGYFSIINSIY
ncbi:MAG: hypothetical protein ACUVUQ_04075, partial [Thermodesulfovibrionales bacterium]